MLHASAYLRGPSFPFSFLGDYSISDRLHRQLASLPCRAVCSIMLFCVKKASFPRVFTCLLLLGSKTRALALFNLTHKSCAAPPPSPDLLSSHLYLHANEPLEINLYNASSPALRSLSSANPDLRTNASSLSPRQALNPICTSQTSMHIVADTSSVPPGQEGYVSDRMKSPQYSQLMSGHVQNRDHGGLLLLVRVDVALTRSLRSPTSSSTSKKHTPTRVSVSPPRDSRARCMILGRGMTMIWE
jgi:hypothetical protein